MTMVFPKDSHLLQYSEWTVIIEQGIINYLALLLWFSMKVLFTAYYSEPDVNNELFICLWVSLQRSSQQYQKALQILYDSFSHHLYEMKSKISLYTCYVTEGDHDTEIVKLLINPNMQTEICQAKFLQNTYISHASQDSFSSRHRS